MHGCKNFYQALNNWIEINTTIYKMGKKREKKKKIKGRLIVHCVCHVCLCL